MRVLVCGGRDYDDRDHIWNTLNDLDLKRGPFKVIIHGASGHTDEEAMIWAQCLRRKHLPFQAQWNDLTHADAVVRLRSNGSRYDAMAGPRRNQRMVDEGKPDLGIAFPGGKGTADMVRRLKAANIPVIEVRPRSKRPLPELIP